MLPSHCTLIFHPIIIPFYNTLSSYPASLAVVYESYPSYPTILSSNLIFPAFPPIHTFPTFLLWHFTFTTYPLTHKLTYYPLFLPSQIMSYLTHTSSHFTLHSYPPSIISYPRITTYPPILPSYICLSLYPPILP